MPDLASSITDTIQSLSQSHLIFPNQASRDFAYQSIQQFVYQARTCIHQWRTLTPPEHFLAHTTLVDCALKKWIDWTLTHAFRHRKSTIEHDIAWLAIGDYGRQISSPYIQHHLQIVVPQDFDQNDLKILRESLQQQRLLLALNTSIRVAFSTSTAKDIIYSLQHSWHAKCMFLETRLVHGSKAVFNTFASVLKHCCLNTSIVQGLIQFRTQHHQRLEFNTALVSEPDLFQSIGGVQDCLLFKYLLLADSAKASTLLSVEDHTWLKNHESYMLTLQFHLQQLTQSSQFKLTCMLKPQMAKALQYDSSQAFMADYYARINHFNFLWEIYTQALSSTQQKHKWWLPTTTSKINGLTIANGQLEIDEDSLRDEGGALSIIRAFKHQQRLGIPLSPRTQRLIQTSTHSSHCKHEHPEINTCLLSILTQCGNVAQTLQTMQLCEVLDNYLPAALQNSFFYLNNGISRLTNGGHILQSVRNLDAIFKAEKPELIEYYEILAQMPDAYLIYLTLVFHDAETLITKAELQACLDGFPLTHYQKELVLFVIEHSKYLLKQARLFNPETPLKPLPCEIPDVNCLNFLYLHSICHLMASSPFGLNAHKKALLTDFYQNYKETIQHSSQSFFNFKKYRLDLQEQLKLSVAPPLFPALKQHMQSCTDAYLKQSPPPMVLKHAEMWHQIKYTDGSIPLFHFEYDPNQACIFLHTLMTKQKGLLCSISAALSKSQFQIIQGDLFPTADHVYIGMFTLEHPSAGQEMDYIHASFEKTFCECFNLDHSTKLLDMRPTRASSGAPIHHCCNSFQPSVNFFHNLSNHCVTIELRGYDHFGLLYQLTRAIFLQGFEIISCKLGLAYCHRIHDTFQITKETITTSELLSLREAVYAIISKTL